MFRNTLYYNVKPLIPLPMRWAMRRWWATRRRSRASGYWPIAPGSERPPLDWPGWPEGKEFCLVLTHDVEGPAGLERCWPLMEMDARAGFRSSFNLTPEGRYSVGSDLRRELAQNGFEVAVHDLHHDGKLYRGRERFKQKAARINHYLKAWDAVGFRSAFMMHQLDWLHELNIEYDASTFDTDPFEPQPSGRNTIFPFWIPAPGSENKAATNGDLQRGYMELPYTLPQDSTVFLLFAERSNQLWKHKIDWIVRQRGMVLLTTHPDYMHFSSAPPELHTYPAELYRELLDWLRREYGGRYWHALPKEVAAYCRRGSLQQAVNAA